MLKDEGREAGHALHEALPQRQGETSPGLS